MLALTQFGDTPIKLPYIALAQATLVAVALAVAYHFAHPANQWVQLPAIAAVMLVWLGLLFLLRIVPKHHWDPIRHILRTAVGRGSVLQFQKRAGLRSLDADERDALRAAVTNRLPDESLVPAAGDGGDSGSEMTDPDAEGARLVRLLRRAGSVGGVPIATESEYDAGISLYLFSDQPVAVRLRKMRQLLATGVDPHELRTLDDLRNDLAKARASLWDIGAGSGGGEGGDGKRRDGGEGVGAATPTGLSPRGVGPKRA
jgi:hypothetical protein